MPRAVRRRCEHDPAPFLLLFPQVLEQFSIERQNFRRQFRERSDPLLEGCPARRKQLRQLAQSGTIRDDQEYALDERVREYQRTVEIHAEGLAEIMRDQRCVRARVA